MFEHNPFAPPKTQTVGGKARSNGFPWLVIGVYVSLWTLIAVLLYRRNGTSPYSPGQSLALIALIVNGPIVPVILIFVLAFPFFQGGQRTSFFWLLRIWYFLGTLVATGLLVLLAMGGNDAHTPTRPDSTDAQRHRTSDLGLEQ